MCSLVQMGGSSDIIYAFTGVVEICAYGIGAYVRSDSSSGSVGYETVNWWVKNDNQ